MGVAEIFRTMDYGPAPEQDGPARDWLADREPSLKLFIAGEWVEPLSGEHIDSLNPATGERLIGIARGGPGDVDAAVAAARAALAPWRSLTGHARARHLYALARMVQRNARLLAVLESLDNGKPIRESRDIDIPLVARHFYHHAGWAQVLEREFPGMGPVGVVGQIIPWNFPLLMLAWKIAPALAAGNTVVLKPARYTSVTAVALAELASRAGLPPGVLNVVTGDGDTGDLIVNHPGVDKIAFTGSTEVGRHIRRATAGTGKRLSMELGGKSPFVVFEDADLDSAVEGVVDAIWFNQGQVCCAGSRLLVQEGVADDLLARLRRRMETLRTGNPLDKAIDLGAIVSPQQLSRIRELTERACLEGATAWQPSWSGDLPAGCFFPPTLVTGAAPASEISQVEVFGPVIVAMTFRTREEAVALANNSPYGLAASVWSERIGMAIDVAQAIKAGTVWINGANLFDAAAGFGGYRESGFGREGGREGMVEYLRPLWEERPLRPESESRSPGRKGRTDRDVAAIDRTAKLYVGGKQVRPDSGYSRQVRGPAGEVLGEAGEGNRKDIRNAVEAAVAATGWDRASGHGRAQVLYFLAENLSVRAGEFASRIDAMTGGGMDLAGKEVEGAIRRLFSAAAWADKFDGAVHAAPMPGLVAAVHEPVGVVGLVCEDRWPLLGMVSMIAPAIAMGNVVVVVPPEEHPLAGTDLYQVLETSDVPPGVVNIVTGARDSLAAVLAAHDEVDAVWYAGTAAGAEAVEAQSAGNLKRTWILSRPPRDWLDDEQGEGHEFLRQAVQVKNIWLPAQG
ncbi:MAG: aldehyde dehydrogenase family protein [Chloroflexota bacterium]